MPIDPNTGVITPDGTDTQIYMQQMRTRQILTDSYPPNSPSAPGLSTVAGLLSPEWLFQFFKTLLMAVFAGAAASTFIWSVQSITHGAASTYIWACAIGSPFLFVILAAAFAKQSVEFVRDHPFGLVIVLGLCWWAYTATAQHRDAVHAVAAPQDSPVPHPAPRHHRK